MDTQEWMTKCYKTITKTTTPFWADPNGQRVLYGPNQSLDLTRRCCGMNFNKRLMLENPQMSIKPI